MAAAEEENPIDSFEFQDADEDVKREILLAYGYDVDEDGFVIGPDGEPHEDPYTGEEVLLEGASILPGSAIVINTSAISLSRYIREHLED